MLQDQAAFADIFGENVRIADRTLPRCNVLFVYGAMDAFGRIAGMTWTFRDLARAAGAHIAVVASGLPLAMLADPGFMKTLPGGNDWPANIVITLDRKGEYFGQFFHRLFALMRQGISMPMAWVELAPQGPVQQHDIPATVMLCEAGHIAFGPKRT